MKLKYLIVTLALSVFAGNAAAGLLYAINDSTRNLITIDTTSLAITTVGGTGVATGAFGDLAYDSSSGTMYWAAGRSNNNLYTVNIATGAGTLIGSHGVGDEFTLGWNGSTLFGQSTSGNVYTLNTGTAAATLIGSNGVYPGGYDYNTSTGQMVLLEAGGGGIYDINMTNGAATLLSSGPSLNDNDIAYDPDLNVYWAIDYSGNLFRYDATTFARTTVLSGLGPHASLEYISGGATVPEPTTLALMGLGLAGIGFSRRRKL